MKKNSVFVKTTMAIALASMGSMVFATTVIDDVANIFITANTDNSINGEGVFIRSNGSGDSILFLQTGGTTTLGATNVVNINGSTASINVNDAVSINGPTTITGTTAVNGVMGITGVTSIVGATSINTTGDAATTIGSSSGTQAATTLISGNSQVQVNQGGTTIVGTTNSITGSTNTVLGTTSINATGGAGTTVGTSGTSVNLLQGLTNSITATGAGSANNIAGTTNINTGVSAATTIGANGNTTSINSNAVNVGTGGYTTAINIGSGQLATTIDSNAGNSSSRMANDVATTMVTSASVLSSNFANPTQGTAGGTTVVLKGAEAAPQAVVDSNGRISMTNGSTPAAESTAALTLTNGVGNTHGLVVTESQATLSGGTQSSSMTLNDRGATFSNSNTGAPITVTGVADGRADYDAVNVRQFAGAISAVTAMANIPALAEGQDRTIGVGVGNFMGKSALALGMQMRTGKNVVLRASVSAGASSGGSKVATGVGAAWAF